MFFLEHTYHECYLLFLLIVNGPDLSDMVTLITRTIRKSLQLKLGFCFLGEHKLKGRRLANVRTCHLICAR